MRLRASPACSVSGLVPALVVAAACSTLPAQHPQDAPLPRDVVAQAARPFYGLVDGKRLSATALTALLKSRPAVCLGESHDDPVHHYVQARVLSLLSSHSVSVGENFASGFEMFQAPFQPVLDAYADGKIREGQFIQQTEYKRRWGFDFSLYRPLLEISVSNGVSLLALNAPKEWSKAVAKTGLHGLTPALRAQLPEMQLDDQEHRRFFSAAMGGHPSAPAGKVGDSPASETAAHAATPVLDKKMERYYQAQVLWDENMANLAASWLSAQPKASRLIVFAGAGHCHRSAIPRRFERRTETPMLSVRPIAEEDLGTSPAPKDNAFDLLLVFRTNGNTNPAKQASASKK